MKHVLSIVRYKHGFSPTHYNPVARRLHALEDHRTSGNTLYTRPSAHLEQRVKDSVPILVNGQSISFGISQANTGLDIDCGATALTAELISRGFDAID